MNYTLEDIKKQSPYPVGELNTAYAKYFVGNSYLYSINDQEVNISNVTFEPGCRNNWHIHHGAGQILLCTAAIDKYLLLSSKVVSLITSSPIKCE
jgi:quercetin dioxygenase-like cupin family protein